MFQLVAGDVGGWKEVKKLYPVHGAATAFFRGKFWVFGGSTGDDSFDHTITDKVRKCLHKTNFSILICMHPLFVKTEKVPN